MSRKRVAVFFGGRSPEHDVSIVSGLQVLAAIDQTKYDAFPVYISLDGEWLVGDILRERESYLLSFEDRQQVTEVMLDISSSWVGKLVPKKSGLFGRAKPIEFDIALPIFHGLYGEDGGMQGLFELVGVPYAGTRLKASAVWMDKVATKRFLHDLDIPYLPYVAIKRPDGGYFISVEKLKGMLGKMKFPMILKPSHLGSSIGVAKVNDLEELSACLPTIFEFDDTAIVEPYVENLVEYNVAVSKISGETKTSAIERPKAFDELLDFKQKYLSGGDNKTGGTKTSGALSEGMLSLTRELNPELKKKQEENIRDWGSRMFDALDGTGAPRIDFIGDEKSGDIWVNEVNPIPGSYGYFLWEVAEDPVLFSEFVTGLLEEARYEYKKTILPKDPVPKDARLFKR